MPPPGAISLLGLPRELQVRVLACLKTSERAGLPLVCKALNQLANDPTSLLWEAMDLGVAAELLDAALQSPARKLLQRRGQRTTALTILFPDDVPELWRQLLGAALPPLFPELRELAFAGEPFPVQMRDLRFVMRHCSRLQGLTIELRRAPFVEVFACICTLRRLTSLNLTAEGPATSPELQEALVPLQHLSSLRLLTLRLFAVGLEYTMPACLPDRLPSLELLCLPFFRVRLPATLGRLRHLSSLRLMTDMGNLWAAISCLKSLKALAFSCWGDDVLLPSQPTAFSHCLTGLSCLVSRRPVQQAAAPERLLALSSLKELHLYRTDLALCLDGASLTRLSSLTLAHWSGGLPQSLCTALEQSCLAHLEVHEGPGVTDAIAAELCQLKGLRSLSLFTTAMTRLPDCMSSPLTALVLLGNSTLELDAAAYHALIGLPELQRLVLCVCRERSPAPAVELHSLAYLQLIDSGLDACVWCDCHAEGWEPRPAEGPNDAEALEGQGPG